MRREDIQGLEYDWLAVDAQGFVALLSTAGGGRVPDAFLQDVDAFDVAIQSVLSLPASTAADCSLELAAPLVNTWKLVAERGLFACDSDPNGGPYRRIARPIAPVRIDDLPTSIAVVARSVLLTNVAFDSATEIADTQIE